MIPRNFASFITLALSTATLALGVAWSSPAAAAGTPAFDSGPTPYAYPPAQSEYADFNVGVRAGFGFKNIGALMANVEAQGAVLPWLSAGGQLGAFVVDAGADPQYCNCVTRGEYVLGYGELSFARPWTVSPVFRLGLGVANTHHNDSDYRQTSSLDPTVYGEAAMALEVWHFYSRLGSSLLVAREAIPGVSLALGARF